MNYLISPKNSYSISQADGSQVKEGRLFTSHSNISATDLILPVTQEHKLYLEGIEVETGFFGNEVEKNDFVN